MSVQIVIADRFAPDALGLLKDAKYEILQEPDFNYKSSSAETTQALIIRSRTKISRELLTKMKNLKVVVTATNGFDHIDFDACREKGIDLFYCPDGNRHSAVELTWGLVLACARRIPFAHAQLVAGRWERSSLYGVELFEKTYGVVGLGRIGGDVARIAHAFGMKVVAYDPYQTDDAFDAAHAKRVGYVELLRASDVISFHVPYTRETHHMVNRTTLSEISDHAILVNTSRGMVIGEQDLAEFLGQGEIAAAGLDVFEREPIAKDSALFSLSNVVLSPHIGANTTEAFTRVSRMAAEKIRTYFERGRAHVSDPLPPEETWYTHPKGFNS